MSKNSLYCASVVLIGLVYGCRPADPSAASHPAKIASARGNSDSPAGQSPNELWNLPDTGDQKPVITDKPPTADMLARQTQAYADRLAKADVSGHLAAARREKGLPDDGPAGSALRDGRAAAHPGAAGDIPSAVKFGNAADVPHGANSPNGADAPAPAPEAQRASADQFASAGTPPNVSTTITPTAAKSDPPLNKDTPIPNSTFFRGQPPQLAPTDEVEQRLFKAVKDYPQDPAAQLDYQLMLFLQNQSVPQLQTLSALSGEDREMLTTLFDGLTNFRNSLRADNNMLLSRKIRPLLEISDRLRTQAELNIPTLALCRDVKGFGLYEPIEPARFEAGKENKIVVYCEVENFSSLLNEQKMWETRLSQEIVLYTESNGLEVWRDKVAARPIVDFSRNRRHDFFIVKMIRLPASLSLGRYIVKVSVVDQQVKRVAESTTSIVVVAE